MLTGSILQKLQAAHQSGQPGKRPLNFGVYYKNTLVEICHALEDAILTTTTPPLVVAAFQRGKWYLQEADRYADLAARSQQVVILAAEDTGFRTHPTSQRENVDVIQLDLNDPVAQEWHLMILAPSYSAMVLCQELPAADWASEATPDDLSRKFYGFWTFEAGLVQETLELAITHIGMYDPELQAQLQHQLTTILQARAETPQDELGDVVTRIVDYLQINQIQQKSAHLDDNLTANELQALLRMAQIMDQTDLVNPMAAAEVATLAEAMGQILDLPAWQLHRLRLAGFLHRLSFHPTEVLAEPAPESPVISGEEDEIVAPYCLISSSRQALRIMSRLRAVATIVDCSHEYWDGSGQPHGIAGETIPLESRILGLMIAFQHQLVTQRQASTPTAPDLSFAQALSACQEQSGIRWDPKLVQTLEILVSSFQQGLILSIAPPKIAASTWMLTSHTQDVFPGA